MSRALILWALSLLPFTAFASVSINEVAWMGTAVSGTNEWIELRNDAVSAVDLSGWTIEADDGSPKILLSGSIHTGGFFLIERTDDTSVPTIIADLVASFGGGLSNAGETLRLKDTSGTAVDVVVGGTDWTNIGGDNTTKDTAQRTSTGWTTALATPKSDNAKVTTPAPQTTSANTTTSTTSTEVTSGSVSKSPPNPYPRPNISVRAPDDRHAFVGYTVLLSGVAYGLYDEKLLSATYRWNFGDGTSGEGVQVEHVYTFPGEYVVTLEVFHANYRNSDRMMLTVIAPEMSVSRVSPGTSGFIELKNVSAQELDCSGWSVATSEGGTSFVLPSNTIILPSKVLLLPNAVTKLSPTDTQGVLMRFPSGALAVGSVAVSPEVVKKEASLPVLPRATSIDSRKTSVKATPLVATPVLESPTMKVVSEQTESAGLVKEASAAVLWGGGNEKTGTRDGMTWLYGGIALLLSIAILLIVRSHASIPTEAEEYAIIEDIIEGKDS